MKKLGGDIEGYVDGEEPLVFHYGPAGERLKNAEDSVRRFYAGEGPQPPKGIFQSLVQTRSSRLTLMVMMAMVVIVVLTTIMEREKDASSVGLVPMTLSSFSFEESVYISLHLQGVSGIAYPQPLQVACQFMLYDADRQLVHRESAETFYIGKEEFLRTTFVDYDILYVEAVVTVGEETSVLRSEVTRS